MIISYNYVQVALASYECTIPWYKNIWYLFTGEPLKIRYWRSITGSNPQGNESLSEHDFLALAKLTLTFPDLQTYFPELEDGSKTGHFLKSARLLYQVKNLDETSLAYFMGYFTNYPERPLMQILDKFANAAPSLLSASNYRKLVRYQAVFNYENGANLIATNLSQVHLNSIFTLCDAFSGDLNNTRKQLQGYLQAIKKTVNSYEILSCQAVKGNRLFKSQEALDIKKPEDETALLVKAIF